jgi:hypothetical protein
VFKAVKKLIEFTAIKELKGVKGLYKFSSKEVKGRLNACAGITKPNAKIIRAKAGAMVGNCCTLSKAGVLKIKCVREEESNRKLNWEKRAKLELKAFAAPSLYRKPTAVLSSKVRESWAFTKSAKNRRFKSD